MSPRYRPRARSVATCLPRRMPRQRGVDLTRMAALLTAALLALAVARGHAHESPTAQAATMQGAERTVSSTVQYTVPAVELIRDDGKVVSLPDEMNDGRPVVLNFVFTSCSSICPVMSEILARFDSKLGTEREHVHLMSISIDPEEDTPARLREYAKRFHAGPEWQHYTGSVEASMAAQRAFKIWRGDKMSHAPVTLVRAAPGQPWLRIDGLVTPDELLHKYQQLLLQSGRTVATR